MATSVLPGTSLEFPPIGQGHLLTVAYVDADTSPAPFPITDMVVSINRPTNPIIFIFPPQDALSFSSGLWFINWDGQQDLTLRPNDAATFIDGVSADLTFPASAARELIVVFNSSSTYRTFRLPSGGGGVAALNDDVQVDTGVSPATIGVAAGNRNGQTPLACMILNGGQGTQLLGATEGENATVLGFDAASQATNMEDSVIIGANGAQFSNSINHVTIGADTIVDPGNNSVTHGAHACEGAIAGLGGSTIIGSFAHASGAADTIGDNVIAIGGNCQRNTISGNSSCVIGYNAQASGIGELVLGSVIGAALNPIARDRAVRIGTNCAAAGANGRLCFGNAMEAISGAANAGAAVLPATPQGFIVTEWNGTVYKVPVYLP